MKKMPDWLGILLVIVAGLWLLPGCASQGFKKGYDDSVRYARGESVNRGYSFGYHKGFEAYVLERGRSLRHAK